MSWKKNGFSCVTWFLYLLIAGTGLFCLVSAAGSAIGLPVWAETGIFGACFPVAGLSVFLLHRFAPKYDSSRKRIRRTAAETLLVILLVAAGLFLRVRGIDSVAGDSLYFDLASLESAKQIPQYAHGAVYFYLRLLHTVFFFFGNELLAAAWFQILAQTVAFLLLYFAARHLAGVFAALIMLGFCELSSYMVSSALTLSPDCLYLLFWAASLIWIVSIRGEELDPVEFVPVGIFAALMGYVDITGFLLLLLAFGLIFSERGGEGGKDGRKASFLVCLGGTILFFFLFLFLDSILSKKSFVSVLLAWFRTYRPEGFEVPVAAGGSALGYAELFVLFAFLLVGVFSFWRDGKRDSIKGWMVGTCVVVLGECFGIFTEEVPAATYLFLLLSLLAGIGVSECFRNVQPGMTALAVKPAVTEKKANGGKPGKQDSDKRASDRKAPDKNVSEKKTSESAAGKEAPGGAAPAAVAAGMGAAGEGTAWAGAAGRNAAEPGEKGNEGPGKKKAKKEKDKQEKDKKEKDKKEKGRDKKGGKAVSEREVPTVKSEDVAAALFGGGAGKGTKPAAGREGAAGGTGAPEGKKTGGVKSEDVAAALFGGGKPSASKPSVGEPSAVERDEGHFDGGEAIPDQLMAEGGGIPEAFGTNGFVSEGYGTSGTAPEVFGAEDYGADRLASEGYGTSGTAPEAFGSEGSGAEPEERPAATRFIENPLPLPKKHEKREVDYRIKGGKPEDDYDYFVADDDDFDI